MINDKKIIEELLSQGILQRVLVSADLGSVHKGDHIIIVAKSVVAVDRRSHSQPSFPPPPSPPSPSAKATKPNTKTPVMLTEGMLIEMIRQHQPVTALDISDRLKFDRSDGRARGKTSRMLRVLLEEKKITRFKDELKRFRYELVEPAASRI